MEQDSIRLLRECDAGVKMGVNTIEDTLEYAENGKLRALLQRSRAHHLELGKEIGLLLDEAKDEGKNPSMMAKGMSMLKTTVSMLVFHQKTRLELLKPGKQIIRLLL